MITSLHIKNFRGFEDLEVKGLKRVNLFAGRNNSGKTSLLEAVFLLGGPNNPMSPAQLRILRDSLAPPFPVNGDDVLLLSNSTKPEQSIELSQVVLDVEHPAFEGLCDFLRMLDKVGGAAPVSMEQAP